MAIYNSIAVATNAAAATFGDAASVKVAYQEVAISAALTTADTINFFDLPPNSRVLYAILEASDLDTNGTPLLTLNIGDAGDADRYFVASTVGQTGVSAVSTAVTGLGYLNTAKTRVVGVPAANAATGVAGTIALTVLYVVEG